MARLNLSLKDVQVQTSSDYSLLPEGKYTVVVGKTEFKETKTGGAAVVLGYKIIEGEHEGKLIKDFVNIQNANPEASRIGLKRLKTVAFATGYESENIADSDDLLNLQPFEVMVTVKDDGQYKNNNVKAVLVTRDVTVKKVEAKKPATMTKPWASK